MKFKTLICSMLCLMLVLFTSSAQAESERLVRVSSTIGPVDAGIIPLLAETFTKQTGIKVTYEKAGTGKTLEKAKTGAFDIVIVHARALEDKFVADGFGIDRRDVMYNDFVILGPASDPAGVKGMTDVKAAFKKIADSKSKMVSRGDNSGTHVKEVEIWKAAGVEPAGDWFENWVDGSKGNGPTTKYANEQQAYVLMDRATYLTLKKEINLQVLVEGDPLMMNYIALIRVNPATFANLNVDETLAFANFLTSKEAQEIIRTFKVDVYGEPLFFPNAK
jgi:tungstate transport system substrate-binding protein